MNHFLFRVNKNNNNVNSRSDPTASFHVPLDFGILLLLIAWLSIWMVLMFKLIALLKVFHLFSVFKGLPSLLENDSIWASSKCRKPLRKVSKVDPNENQ